MSHKAFLNVIGRPLFPSTHQPPELFSFRFMDSLCEVWVGWVVWEGHIEGVGVEMEWHGCPPPPVREGEGEMERGTDCEVACGGREG